jgi:hypothetical protein
VLQVVDGARKAGDFVLAHDDGKPFRRTAGGNILDSPWPLEGDGVEKPKGGNRDNNRAAREASLLRQVDQILADLIGSEMLGGFAKMTGKPEDFRDIRALGVCRQVADLHIVNHATAKRAHGQLLCEMDSATWRPRIVSLLSCETRQDVFRSLNNQCRMGLK